METSTERLAAIRARIQTAAQRAGRSVDDITLIGVSKTHTAERVTEMLRAGLSHLGENKVQEAAAKIELVGRGHWHLIGHLQSNKARHAVVLFDSIDSVDSLALAQEISRRAVQSERHLRVLLEVNLAGEASKFGVRPEDAPAVAETLAQLPQLQFAGLMTVPPFYADPEKARPVFAQLRELRDRLEKSTGLQLPVLSMGMSHDFEIAIAEGATEVRVGTALFGERDYVIKPRPIDEP